MRSCCFIFIAGVLLLSLTVAIPVAAAIQANGTISVVSQGWVPAGGATVSIDGVPAGTIPPALTVTVPAGTLLALLEGAGADVESFQPLVRFTPYAVQARYEEGPPGEDDALDRPAVVVEVSALLTTVAAVLSSAETGGGDAPARP